MLIFRYAFHVRHRIYITFVKRTGTSTRRPCFKGIVMERGFYFCFFFYQISILFGLILRCFFIELTKSNICFDTKTIYVCYIYNLESVLFVRYNNNIITMLITIIIIIMTIIVMMKIPYRYTLYIYY